MCGRYVSASSSDAVSRYFHTEPPVLELAPSWNVAPTDDVHVVVERHVDDEIHRRLAVFRWGLVPRWAKDLKAGSRMINARADTIMSKNAFKPAFEKRRCIVPADGFYEWMPPAAGEKRKRPVYLSRPSGEPLALAGLWETWRDPADADGPLLFSCTVVTTEANTTVRPAHDRMPVLLADSSWEEWLDRDNQETDSLARLLVPAPDDYVAFHFVGPDVNDVRNNGPHLIAPLAP